MRGEAEFARHFNPMTFRTEYTLHVRYKQGWASFRREEQLEFAPFVGLDVLDDSVGQFTLTSVAWYGGKEVKMFLCQSQLQVREKNLQQVTKMLKVAGWTEDKEARSAASADE
jgi:hypothetical protein